MDTIGQLLDRITETLPTDRRALRRLKTRIAAESRSPLIRNDALLTRYRQEVAHGLRQPDERLERILMLNGIRSQSGIATVTVITEPYACPGRCVYCPTEARAPKSYLTNEPAVMRALRNDYDPYRQVTSRLEALMETGHPTDKIELIIKGGTWSFYPDGYQRTFIQRCVEAANEFRGEGRAGETGGGGNLEETLTENETASCRVIGITIETRPDYVDEAEIRRLRSLGVTRVELGVQTLEESVLERIVRDHGTKEVREATQLLKDAGFKVAYHLMPNLPGATPESDLETARSVFTDPEYQPDTIKLYPCVVIETAELYQWWKDGRYTPYDDETLIELLMDIKRLVPPHVRIERVIRDIPSTSIRAGCLVTNLREEVHRRMRARGLACRCLRCRQVRETADGTFILMRRDYPASGGRETFLSFEDTATDRVASFLRLRIASTGAGLIRELHSYGHHLPLHQRRGGAVQHQGFGQRLLQEAERIAREEFSVRRLAVIAGVGVREYYRKFGYELQDTYMVKELQLYAV
ncbi:MAG: tRNA uridine(34) 5-carboxymethylaminomethyl modification radical SAM/GNAT enzyme Elp3 [Candidatus Omnitrophota bacterium]|nr:tRNA uridine(34) 5-carboxymethylaminomethyl modification radical SAM/GNAT enzyme Elp3 [Candidatus Omnitrophota bacterium]